MFKPTSRYASAATTTVLLPDGRFVPALRLPIRGPAPVLGMHTRANEQRLDHIAHHYLGEASAFWRLCDASDAIAPDALAARSLVPVPAKGR